jgi:hypothetical protein
MACMPPRTNSCTLNHAKVTFHAILHRLCPQLCIPARTGGASCTFTMCDIASASVTELTSFGTKRSIVTCRKVVTNDVLASQQVKVVKGQDSFLKYKSSDPLTRHMCDACGCHMFGKLEGDTPNIVSMQLSTHVRAIARSLVRLASNPAWS